MAELRNELPDEPSSDANSLVEEGSSVVRSATSYLASFAFHMALILILALLTVPPRSVAIATTISASTAPFEEIEDFRVEVPAELSSSLETADSFNATASMNVLEDHAVPSPDLADAAVSADIEITEITIGVQGVPSSVNPLGRIGGDGFYDLAKARRSMKTSACVSAESERAVTDALKWLARHQLDDGSWNFDHRSDACRGVCSRPGNLSEAKIGATSLALLPFLGAGYTHGEGEYKKVVERGIEFLLSRIDTKNGLGDCSEPGGNLYSHGLASIVLCEAYAMSRDKRLLRPAQATLDYIAAAQDPVGGGWRYKARQPGDTSVVGWQLMALKSGHLSYLKISPQTIAGASRFLDSVQSESGSKYGYTNAGSGDATTAIGLLCRMHLGWSREHPAIENGMKYLSERGPSATNLYYDYYAAQVMRHFEGEQANLWHKRMKSLLVESQSHRDHETGSWFVSGGDHGSDRGGRLYCTAMAAMILEVHYRTMPIYGKAATDEDFPL